MTKPTIPNEELYKMLAKRRADLPASSMLNRRGLVPLLLRIVAATAMWTLIAAPLLAMGLVVAAGDWVLNWIKRRMK
jgi:hypothetical protein